MAKIIDDDGKPVTKKATEEKPETLRTVVNEVVVDADKKVSTKKATRPPTSKVIELLYPVSFADIEYTSLTMSRMKTKDLRRVNITPDDDPVLAGIKMIAALCHTEAEVIDELDTEDFALLQEAINELFPNGLPGLAQ